MLASYRAVQEVTSVHLYARLGGKHLQADAGVRGIEAGSHNAVIALAVGVGVEAPVVVVARGVSYLVVVGPAD